MGPSAENVQNFIILFFVCLLPMSKTMETYSILKPCVNCDELHVKLGQNLPLQPQVSSVMFIFKHFYAYNFNKNQIEFNVYIYLFLEKKIL